MSLSVHFIASHYAGLALLLVAFAACRPAHAQESAAPPLPIVEATAVCKTIEPEYPAIARKHAAIGSVMARARVVDGEVRDVVVLSGHPVFHEAVITAIKRYQCDGRRGEYLLRQPFVFSVNGFKPSSEWRLVHVSEAASWYADATSVRRSDGHARVWVMQADIDPLPMLKTHSRSMKAEVEVDCVNPQVRILATVLYQSRDATGPLLAPVPKELDWSVAARNSAGEGFWEIGCRGAAQMKPRSDSYAIDLRGADSQRSNDLAGGPGSIPVDKTYHELTTVQQDLVRAQYEQLAANDEPPFPAAGLRPLIEAVDQATRKLLLRGHLSMVVQVDATGTPTSVNILASPDRAANTIAAAALVHQAFKPALCGGTPCPMHFPIRLELGPS